MKGRVSVTEYKIAGHEASYLPKGKEWKLVWSDEFDGHELDRTKWDFRLNFWGNRFPAYTDEGVMLDGNSNLKICLVEKDGQYASAQLQTGTNVFDYLSPNERSGGFCGDAPFWPFQEIPEPKFLHSYGYYEVRCKLQEQPGWWSAFWLQAKTPGISANDPSYCGIEVDIMENFARDGEVTSGMFYGNYTSNKIEDARVKYTVKETDDGFHRFGVHWGKDGYVFYCDGVETARSQKGQVSKIPQFILLTTECIGFRHTPPQPCEELRNAVLPDCFTVDYVRVFDEI